MRDQALFREVNKRIREVSDSFGDANLEFLCECGRATCGARFELGRAQFDELAADGARLLLAAEHKASLDAKRITAEYPSFVVVTAEPEAVDA